MPAPGGDKHPHQQQQREQQTPIEISSESDNKEIVHNDHDSHDGRKLNARTFLAVFAVCLIYFAQLVNLVGAGAVRLLPLQIPFRIANANHSQQGQAIAGHFGATTKVVWLSAPITILTVVLGPPVSQAADYWGRKWLLVVLTLFGAVGSIVVARAQTINTAIAGFCIIGVSYGAQPLLHTVTSEVLPRRWRAYGQAADMASNSLGSICGLLVGGELARKFPMDGFRYYYYMTMGWYVIAAALCAVAYNPPRTTKQREFRGHTWDKIKRLDWIGYFLLAVGLVLFCMALSWSQNPYRWDNPHILATFIIGVIFSMGLVIYEWLLKKDGMFHHGLFKRNRNFAIALFAVFAEGVAFFAANIYFPFQLNAIYEPDPLLVGARYSLMLVCAVIGAVLTGWYCAYVRKVRWVTVLAFVIFVAFFACMATTDRGSNQAIYGYPVLLGFGLGMTLTTLVTVAQLCTPPHLIAVASGIIISVRSLGGTIGIAIYNAIFLDQVLKVPENVAAAVVPLGLTNGKLGRFVSALQSHNQTQLQSIPGVTPEIIEAGTNALLDTFLKGFRHVWTAAACFVAVAAVVSMFLFDPSSEFNMHVDAPVDQSDSD